jgi:hypothetical protein
MATQARPRTSMARWSLAAGLCLALASSPEAGDARWPPFLPPRDSLSEASLVEQVWVNKTFQRSFSAPPLNVPMTLYAALIDSPDVVAAAAIQLGIANDTAERQVDGSYELRSSDGSRARYRVLVSEANRRVVFSHGHVVILRLSVKGSVLGILDLHNHGDGIHQLLTVHAHVENTAWALLTKLILALLPSLADEELGRGFRIARDVATWALRDRGEFCAWLIDSRLESANVAAAASC